MRVAACVRQPARWVGLAALALLASSSLALAQTTTGRVRGVVTDSAGAPISEADVAATSVSSGLRRAARTDETGAYNLPSLPPADYRLEVRRIGYRPEARQFRVGVGQVLVVDFRLASSVVQLEEIAVRSEPVAELRSSEVATNVSEAQIENLPTASRNFLDLAALAPGVRVSEDRASGTSKTFAAGALPAENINVFVDGASYKNDIISGGVVGQDASRGNPFPRNAVQEYRVITNNFKAEYQKASSAIVTAATKSGGNEWEGSAFVTFQNEGLVALDSFARRSAAENPAFQEPAFNRYLAGLSAGGPLIRDRLFFFGSWEGNFQNRDGVVRFNGDEALWPAAMVEENGMAYTAPFRSNLFFGKLTYNMSEYQMLEFTSDWRHETDIRGFGGQFSGPDRSFSAAENLRQDIITSRLKHTYLGQNWVNEAFIAYQYYNWNPEPEDFTTIGSDYRGFGRIGGRDSRQDLAQKRFSIRDDLTFTGLEMNGEHVIKMGVNVDFASYRMNKQLNENPLFIYDAANAYEFPIEAVFGFGEPEITGSNAQFGVYVQDDWTPTSRLTLNLGVRYDVETGPYNLDYVTPQAVVDSLTALAGDFFVDVDPARYFTDGDDRSTFKGAIQPRVGFSYALGEFGNTVIFGSAGIFYDRINFNSFIDESYRRQHPNYRFRFNEDGSGGQIMWDDSYLSREGLEGILASGQAPPQEVFLLPNDMKPPKSYQFAGGVRHDFGGWNSSLSYTGVRGKNGFSFEWANLTYNPATNDCCISVPTPAYQNVLVGNNEVRSWYDAVALTVDRPYRADVDGGTGWGAGLAYTLSWAEAEGNDLFSFPQVALNPRHPIGGDQTHRIVGNFIVDLPFLYGIQFSGFGTVATGTPFQRLSFEGGERTVLGYERADTYRRIDLRARKDFPGFMGGSRFGVIADLFNAFNFTNLGCYNTVEINGAGEPDPNFGLANCVVTDGRRLQPGLEYDF